MCTQIVNKKIVVICGSTGVGKTDLSLQIAQTISGNVINADMGQLYIPLNIGTAKPNWQQSKIPHYLFDIIGTPVDFSAPAYRRRVEELLGQLTSPIIVGGSTLYIQSLFFPPVSQKTVHDPQKVDQQKTSWQDLYDLDPDRAEKIHPHDTYRIQRALNIWHATHEKPSSYAPCYNPLYPYFNLIILIRDRDDLYERINKRVVQMLDQGWIEEVEELMGTEWETFLLRKKIIGYDDIINYLKQSTQLRNKQKLIESISQKTRNYAKRQNTFWRMLEKKLAPCIKDSRNIIYTVNLTHTQLDDVLIKKLYT